MQVVVVPVANMYSKPTEKADVVSQAIYGNNVKLLEARGEWSRIQTP
ncbi:MAG: glycoside hydrolase, partial [Acidobacteria bacterium]